MECELLVMSVTRLSDGVCVACLDERNRWVRPTREKFTGWRQLNVRDLCDAEQRVVVQVGNVVRWTLHKPMPRDVHTEDVAVGNAWPVLKRWLVRAEPLRRCRAVRESDLRAFLGGPRSLTVMRPDRITRVSFSNQGKAAVAARIEFRLGTLTDDYSVMDLRWRALGRGLLAQSGQPNLCLTARQLWARTGIRFCYLAVGRSQGADNVPPHRLAGRYWPFFISVFTQVPVNWPIDYANL